MKYALLLLALAGCAPAMGSSLAELSVDRCGDIVSFGAIPDDGLDDSPAIQDAVDTCAAAGGGEVGVPTGVFTLARHEGWDYYGVSLADGVHLRGYSRAGSVLEMLPGTAPSVRLLSTNGAVDAAITDLTLDGRKDDQSVSPHRHAIFADTSSRLRLERLNIYKFTGDGIYLYYGANDTVIRDVDVHDNDRNGLTLGSTLHGVAVVDSAFKNNYAQQIDSEPTTGYTVNDVSIRGCHLAGGNSYALTISGTGTTSRGHTWDVSGNRIDGSVFVVWADRVSISGNIVRNPLSGNPGIEVYRGSSAIVVANNVVESPVVGVRVLATSVGQQPDDVVVSGNTVKITATAGFGIELRGPLRATVTGNSLVGPGSSSAGYSGIRLRSTVAVRSAVIADNTLRGFSVGILVVVNETIGYQSISGNVLDNGTTVGATP